MMYEAKKLALPGLAGVLVACLIFTTVLVAPWSTATTPTFPSGLPLESPLTVNVFISNFTEPLGVGSEAVLTVIVTSTRDVNGTTVKLDLLSPSDPPMWPLGISIIEGNLSTWNGNLRANISISFNAKIKVVEVGYALIRATATWYQYEYLRYNSGDSLYILIFENDIQVSKEPITPPDYYEAKPGNGTLPIWPNGTSWEP